MAPTCVPRTSVLPSPAMVTIAISGSSSSGKTTAAILLAEIFSDARLDEQGHPLSARELVDLDSVAAGTEIISPVVIHEDAYFKDKSFCPTVVFRNDAADVSFVQSSMIGNKCINPQYSTMYNNCQHIPHSDDSDAARHLPYVAGWLITGPDTDCYSSLDVPALVDAIKHVKATGSLSEACIQRNRDTAIQIPGLLTTAAQRFEILTQHAGLVRSMRKFLQDWTADQVRSRLAVASGREVARPALCIVDGFLLFPDPLANPPNNYHAPGITRLCSAASTTPLSSPPVTAIESSSSTLSSSSSLTMTDASRATSQILSAKAKSRLLSQFDVKLFLPSSKHQAKARRFVRTCYIDSPDGERRPGQMWKTVGYFNDVAWANYEKEHGWIFKDGRIQGDVVHVSENEQRDSDEGMVSDREVGHDHIQLSEESMGELDANIIKDPGLGKGETRVADSSRQAERHGVCVRREVDADVSTTIQWAMEKILRELEARDWTLATESEGDEMEKDATSVDEDPEESGYLDAGIETKQKRFQGCFCS